MKKPSVKLRRLPELFLATLLATGTSAFGGDMTLATTPNKTLVSLEEQETNPLSFLNGSVVFDIQERLRGEVRENNYDFNSDVDALTDDSWLLQRFRIGVAVKPVSWLKLYVQGQDSREAYSDRPNVPTVLGSEGDDAFDLRQAYIQLGDPKGFTLTVGRQLLSYGDERLIGSFDWNNIGRTFDAVKARYAAEKWSLDAFASTVVVPKRHMFNQSDAFNGNETNRGQIFSGLYFSTTALSFQTTDLYILHLHEDTNASYLPTATGNTDFATFGFRIKSKPGVFHHEAEISPSADGKSTVPASKSAPKLVGFNYDAEAAFQTGEQRGLDLTAYAIHAGAGYTFDAPWTPRLGIEGNYGSGDNDPTDGSSETFQNLFPTNHKFYGYMDVFSWQNMKELAAQLKLQPAKTVTVQLDYHAFWLASTDDVWYRANGITPVRALTPAARNADSFAGSEADVTVTWNVRKWASVQVGYSLFFAGQYLSDTGADSDADFGYVQTTFNF